MQQTSTHIGCGFATDEGRDFKAKKIASVVKDYLQTNSLTGLKILDIGAGSGHIAQYFSKFGQVNAVDVVDQRAPDTRGSFDFTACTSQDLPFPSQSFDLVLSNHVIAYMLDPVKHIKEIARVLKPGGIAYLATPNGRFPLEPHTKIPCLHWFPRPLYRSVMKAWTGRADALMIPSVSNLKRWSRSAGLHFQSYTAKVIKNPGKFAMPGSQKHYLPDVVECLSPTIVAVLHH